MTINNNEIAICPDGKQRKPDHVRRDLPVTSFRSTVRSRTSQIVQPDRTKLINEVEPGFEVACITCLQIKDVTHLPSQVTGSKERSPLELTSAARHLFLITKQVIDIFLNFLFRTSLLVCLINIYQ
ncbi:hypothetical protein [Actimicrobium sp. CCI2.3]|uniref:hypothetical protein n=1 Tax=Actimicrobium sp. CCI2.3 TaxID=3048616 RepID=UPI002AB5C181|nr:hypothetical protein [Actimicrobium sp. CCI2.3]MDY7575490.1 hypothetical protein [Actimicrobium sp. CCI2.3]MEB0023726.1 hypothetical protein [Actimicrobium sp. CCI2.3]